MRKVCLGIVMLLCLPTALVIAVAAGAYAWLEFSLAEDRTRRP